jgi:hypothetical protein
MQRDSVASIMMVLAVVGASASAERALADLVPISGVTANGPNTFPTNPPSVLVDGAQGDYNYVAPNPGSGGGGTSWHTPTQGTTPVVLTFSFTSTAGVDEVVLWDYYGHTPQLWTVKLFSGASGGGAELLSYDFSIGSHDYDALRWNVSIPVTLNVNSAQLVTRSNAQWQPGVGLAEVAFVAAAVPEASSCAVVAIAFVASATGAWLRRRRGADL